MKAIVCIYCPRELGSELANGAHDLVQSCLRTPEGYICIACIDAGKHNSHAELHERNPSGMRFEAGTLIVPDGGPDAA